eukprot:COSAG02_NODE_16263_length_1098_cov_1.410410_2_plen_108_part_00
MRAVGGGNRHNGSRNADHQAHEWTSKLTYVNLVANEASIIALAKGIGGLIGGLLSYYYALPHDGWGASDFRDLGMIACAACFAVWYFFLRSTCAVSLTPNNHLRYHA